MKLAKLVRRMKGKGFLFFLFVLLVFSSFVYSAGIVNSRHDLSALWGKGMQTSYNQYNQVCVYCHTPHGGKTEAPLWNRNVNSPGNYILYNSATMDNSPSTVSGISLACLSCHDGTIAVDSLINAPGSGLNWTGANSTYHRKMSTNYTDNLSCSKCHAFEAGYGDSDHRVAYLGTDLSNDHPISMNYPPTSDFKTPDDPNKGWGGSSPSDIKLYAGKVECASCHNVHDPAVVPFLRISNSSSQLCMRCHVK